MECQPQLLLVYFEMRFSKVLSNCLLLLLSLAAGECLYPIRYILGYMYLKVFAVSAADPGYLLYTRRNRDAAQRIEPSVESLLRTSFYALEPVV